MGPVDALLGSLEARRKHDGHSVVGIQGEPGVGKSTLALFLALRLNPEFTVKQVHYSRNEWRDIVLADKGQVFILDEGANVAMSRTWADRDQTKLMQLLNMIRQRNHTLIWCTPNLQRLDVVVREDLITHKINCVSRGQARILTKYLNRDGEHAGWKRWPGVITWKKLDWHPIWQPYVAAKADAYKAVSKAVQEAVAPTLRGAAANPAKRNTYRDPITHKFIKRPIGVTA